MTASSAFSFHCMICFEEFDPENNYPVVLPCGHTYVCINCANRLDRCMECRTPLTIKMEAPPPPPGGPCTPEMNLKENQHLHQHARMSPGLLRRQQLVQSRYGGHSPDVPPPKPPAQAFPKQRLPLPKNAVLLSLIQASEPARRRATAEIPPDVPPEIQRNMSGDNFNDIPRTPSHKAVEKFNETLPTPCLTKESSQECSPGISPLLPKFSKASPLFTDARFPAPHSSSSAIDDNDVEEHQIRVATYLQGGPCGTYAVAVKNGLLVYPTLFENALPNTATGNDARSKQGTTEQPDQWKRDVDEIVKSSYIHKQQKMKQQDCQEKNPMRVRSVQSSRMMPTLFDCDEWQVEAAISAEHTPHDVGMKLSLSSSHESDNRDDVIVPDISASYSIESSDDNALQKSISLTNTMAFTRQLSVPISAPRNEKDTCDEFDRPLIRLKYGDRVQVVSMDSRGWVKLARGYGYIRLQNGKQLVKVGGTSDRACQIEATLHELSIERERLKHEQTKLERLSAGLMIDLQSTLLTSDDHVICPAPEGMIRFDTERKTSWDDLSISASASLPKSEGSTPSADVFPDVRMTKSHSPGRSRIGTPNPPSPSGLATPTRVNFRTGMSGHRALLSSNSHPHDFIGTPGSRRSMSNHSGISKVKKTVRPRASIY